MPVILNLEDKIINMIRGERYKWFTTGVNLGGVTGVSGGTGAPLGGFIGQLVQSKVTYDTSENEIWDIPVSGESLVTNLDRIRYRIATLESGGSGISYITIHDEGIDQGNVTILDFLGTGVEATVSGSTAFITVTVSGGGGASNLDDLLDVVITSVANNEVLAYDSGSSDWINQTAAEAGLSATGHTHVEANITDLDHDAVAIQGIDVVAWSPTASGEVLIYDGNVYAPGTVSGGGGDTDTKQVLVSSNDTTEGYLEDKITAGASVTVTTLNDGGDEDVEISVSGLSVLGHSHTEADITDLDHDAVSIQGIDVVDWSPTVSGEVLVYDGNVYAPGTVSGGGGSSTFLTLTDVDEASYVGFEGYSVVVNTGEDGLEFVNVSGGGGSSYTYALEDVTGQVPGAGDDYTLAATPASGSLSIHLNGLTQQPNNYNIITGGFHTNFTTISGDELVASYYTDVPSENILGLTLEVEDTDVSVATNVEILNFEGMVITDEGSGKVTISGGTGGGNYDGTYLRIDGTNEFEGGTLVFNDNTGTLIHSKNSLSTFDDGLDFRGNILHILGNAGQELVEFDNTSVDFNEPLNNVDIKFHGDTKTNVLVVDAGLDAAQLGNFVEFKELASNPSTPTSTWGRVFARDDGAIYYRNDGGTIYDLTSGGGGGGGIEVEEDDVSVATGVTVLNFEGAVEVTDEGSGKVTINISGGGGGGTPDFTMWMCDAPPASGYSSSGVDDDEFDDSSFDTGIWTVFDVPSTQTETEAEYGLSLETGTANVFQGVFQPIPSGSNWSFTTYIGAVYPQSNDQCAGILLLSDIGNLSTSDCFIWGIFRGGAGYGWRWAKATNYSGTGYSDGSWINDNKDIGLYLRLRTDSTTWYFDWSADGLAWITSAYSQTKEFTPQGIGLGQRLSSANWLAPYKFARFTDISASNQVLYGDRVNMWRAT